MGGGKPDALKTYFYYTRALLVLLSFVFVVYVNVRSDHQAPTYYRNEPLNCRFVSTTCRSSERRLGYGRVPCYDPCDLTCGNKEMSVTIPLVELESSR
jgi:hypothetical protein